MFLCRSKHNHGIIFSKADVEILTGSHIIHVLCNHMGNGGDNNFSFLRALLSALWGQIDGYSPAICSPPHGA